MSLVQNLYRDYGDFKVDILEWELSDEGVTALWGPSGAGKTSVFQLLIGLEPCPGLKWEFQGQDLAALPMQERRLGIVFQSYEIFPPFTAQQNILFAAEVRKIDSERAGKHLRELAAILQLESCLSTQGALLSGGEKQRTALARALIGSPRFLLLDEPFSHLDQNLRASARQLVKQVIEKHKVPTLLITHDKGDLKALAQVVMKIENGRLVGSV